MRREKRVHAGAVHQTHAPYALLSTADSGGRRGRLARFFGRVSSHRLHVRSVERVSQGARF